MFRRSDIYAKKSVFFLKWKILFMFIVEWYVFRQAHLTLDSNIH
jgi:hypothetical protein